MTTTPNVPLRLELTFEMPGTPEQVWDAIATANGISAWFLPTDLEEREGGAVAFHMGETGSRRPRHRLGAARDASPTRSPTGPPSAARRTPRSRRWRRSSSSRRSPAARAWSAS